MEERSVSLATDGDGSSQTERKTESAAYENEVETSPIEQPSSDSESGIPRVLSPPAPLLLPVQSPQHLSVALPSNNSSHSSSEDVSSSDPSSRMENGASLPRLAAGVYHRRPEPILTDPAPFHTTDPLCSRSMHRGPPPSWQPPRPPEKGPYDEETYEDPETHRNGIDAREPLLHNSYEVSASQMRRSQMADWSPQRTDNGERVLHKNADGAYYIPGRSVRTATSTLSPAGGNRYTDEQCVVTALPQRGSRVEPQSTLLKLHHNTNTVSHSQLPGHGGSLIKRRSPSAMQPSSPASFTKPGRGCSLSPLVCCLLTALAAALLLILVLLLRSPSYVYSGDLPEQQSSLRPLPSEMRLGERYEAELMPSSFSHSELLMPRAGRVLINVSMGAGAQLVLLGRQGVSPSLSLHDLFRPLRADSLIAKEEHVIEHVLGRRKRHVDMLAPRFALIEHFMLQGRWHLAVINERNRVEPVSVSAVFVPSSSLSPEVVRCEADCSNHGECLAGKCVCAAGYAGDICDQAMCPVVCSGNGVFSGGVCLCRPGFKGRECDLRSSWCEVADCNGRGRCEEGACRCQSGWTGDACEKRSCADPLCSSHGVCVNGLCYCEDGWTGSECAKRVELAERHTEQPVVVVEEPTAAASPLRVECVHGSARGSICHCETGWTGDRCHLPHCPSCLHGQCTHGVCVCHPGWTGDDCNARECLAGCAEHGECQNNGTCVCHKGWNGLNCYSAGCPSDCSGHGECRLVERERERWTRGVEGGEGGQWACACEASWRGTDCAIPIETSCDDGVDNDGDGLADCDDPECCVSEECSSEPSCAAAPSPRDVLLRMPGVSGGDTFHHRVRFLVSNDSVQSYADTHQFVQGVSSVVRGRVVWSPSDGALSKQPLPGVRVSDSAHPLYGFTLTQREQGEFDLLVNGGRTVQLQFLRNPFRREKRVLYVPPNEIVYMGDVVMRRGDSRPERRRPECGSVKRAGAQPRVWSSWQTAAGAPLPDGRPHSMADTRTLSDSVAVGGTRAWLVYDSWRAKAAHSWIRIALLEEGLPEGLRQVHVHMDVAGRRLERVLSAVANLSVEMAWDGMNAYRQPEYGLVPATVRVGLEYAGCSRSVEYVWWEGRVKVAGRPARRDSIGGWTLHIHHHLDVVNEVLERGDGGRVFVGVSSDSVIATSVAGKSGERRAIDCQTCDGDDAQRLFRPTALATTLDGLLVVGDHNLIRIRNKNGSMTTLLQLSISDSTHDYYVAVSPIDGLVYISLPVRRQIWRLKTMRPEVGEEENNHELLAGDGQSCSSVRDGCGDGGSAVDAQLAFPKHIDFDGQGRLIVADGRRIRVVDPSGSIRTLVEGGVDGGAPKCLPLHGKYPLSKLNLEWPASVAVDRNSGWVYVLDGTAIYRLDVHGESAEVVTGAPSGCAESPRRPQLAAAKALAVGPGGELYVMQSDGKKMNQVRVLPHPSSSPSSHRIAGSIGECACDTKECGCDSPDGLPARAAMLGTLGGVAVDGKGTLFVADTGNAKIKSVGGARPIYDPVHRLYRVDAPERDESYFFNRYGLHMATQSVLSGRFLYNFTYHVDTSLGRLSQVVASGGVVLRIVRQNETNGFLESSSGERTSYRLGEFDSLLERIEYESGDVEEMGYEERGLWRRRSGGGGAGAGEAGWDGWGRVDWMREGDSVWTMEGDTVLRNGQPAGRVAVGEADFEQTGSYPLRVIWMDEGVDARTPTAHSLFDAHSHPLLAPHLAPLLSRRTQPSYPESSSVVDSVRPSHRFNWRPWSKRSGERVAEVNGVATFSVEYNRHESKETWRKKADQDMFSVWYTETGEVKAIRPAEADPPMAVLEMDYDAMGRRSELRFGKTTQQWTYDAENRVIESVVGNGSTALLRVRYGYTARDRVAASVERAGLEWQLEREKGRVQAVTTPSGEKHEWAGSVLDDRTSLVKRKYPFARRAFSVIVDRQGVAVEWASADELRAWRETRDEEGRVRETLCDGRLTQLNYSHPHSLSYVMRTEGMERRLRYIGDREHVIEEEVQIGDSASLSSFSVEYGPLLLPSAVHPVLGGVAIQPLRFEWNPVTASLAAIDHMRISETQRGTVVHANKMRWECGVDASFGVKHVAAVAGSVSAGVGVERDSVGRVERLDWQTAGDRHADTMQYDEHGRLAVMARRGGEYKWHLKYDKDGRLKQMSDVTIEYGSGGVPRKAGETAYSVDGNGWTWKRGETLFSYDGLGRLTRCSSKEGEETKLVYDERDRLLLVETAKEWHRLFYALPHQPSLVSHISSSSSPDPLTLFYSSRRQLFAALAAGVHYLLLSDESSSPRLVISPQGIVKEVVRGPTGAVVRDSNPAFYLPIGYLGGIDVPQCDVTIIDGRPFDTTIGRFMSFGPSEVLRPPNPAHLAASLDVFSLQPDRDPASVPAVPSDGKAWLRVFGYHPAAFDPLYGWRPAHSRPAPSVSTRPIASFAQRLDLLSRVETVRRSVLMEGERRVQTAREHSALAALITTTRGNGTTLVSLSDDVTGVEASVLRRLLSPSTPVRWPVLKGGERHLWRSDAPDDISSDTYPHFTLVASAKQVEIRIGKEKMIVHLNTNEDAVLSSLWNEVRRKEEADVWRGERRAVERGKGRGLRGGAWPDAMRTRLVQHGKVEGVELRPRGLRLESVHQFTFE